MISKSIAVTLNWTRRLCSAKPTQILETSSGSSRTPVPRYVFGLLLLMLVTRNPVEQFWVNDADVVSLASDPAGRFLAAADDGALYVWDRRWGNLLFTKEGRYSHVEFLGSDYLVVADLFDGVVVLNWRTGAIQSRFDVLAKPSFPGKYLQIVFNISADSKSIAIAFRPGVQQSSPSTLPCDISVWSLDDPSHPLYTLSDNRTAVTGVCFHPTLPILVSNSYASIVRVWDLRKMVATSHPIGPKFARKEERDSETGFDSRRVDPIHFVLNGSQLFVETQLLEFPIGTDVPSPDFRDRIVSTSNNYVCNTQVSNDGRYMALGFSQGTIQIWNLRTKQWMVTYRVSENESKVTSIHFTPDNRKLISGTSGVQPAFVAYANGVWPNDKCIRVCRLPN